MTDVSRETPATTGLGHDDQGRNLVEPSSVGTKVPYTAEGPSASRRWLKAQLANRIDPSVLDDVLVCASELVTNASRHTQPSAECHTIQIFLQHGPGYVRVDVFDNGSNTHVPEVGDADLFDIAGRGLKIVQALADRWGSYGSRSSGAVWFEFHTHVGELSKTDTARSTSR